MAAAADDIGMARLLLEAQVRCFGVLRHVVQYMLVVGCEHGDVEYWHVQMKVCADGMGSDWRSLSNARHSTVRTCATSLQF